MKKIKLVFEKIVDYFRMTDKLLWLFCLSCCGYSILMMYSLYVNGFISSSRSLAVQMIGVGLGVIAAIILSKIDYELLAKLWKFHLPVTVLLVVLTYFIGTGVEGATDKAWLNLGITTIQPSEFLKLSFILTFGLHLSKVKDQMNRLKNILLLGAHAGIICVLIFLQQDYGTALVFICIALSMLVVAGLSWKYIVAGVVALPMIVFVVWNYIFTDMHRRRVLIAFNPDMDPMGDGYQQVQGRMAIGSGGLFGKGLFSNDLINVPEMRNDFIFSYIGQTLGFVGCLVVLALLAAICIRVLLVARKSRDTLGELICVGIFAIVLFQSLLNLMMVLCAGPVIGITLPFFSSGGSSVLTMVASMGLVLSVYMKNNRKMMFE